MGKPYGKMILPASSQVAVTPDDSNDLPGGVCNALEVIATGDVACIAAADTAAITRTAVPAGTVILVRARRVKATGTTATVVALY
ncbi:hypothetical protein EN781_00190 [Mesorhizobium sp. M4A.F.Ca.ET.090.04.2.1]|uniref:spike base protein, RCAP_Rcc01079 family n=1 Tax=Mesorhizobium sp. M4A.F.Ca.ET.090.04.2.1 TaxID=2496663 RepID=UPI000FCC9DA4|nr:hypothetical protein [Mesorhizobium sp. M4A.F.Ca.ET.090.04.2.1]RVC47590.1 hypothetical protein EN781_00190 [Mesorhizobium sp. M4A.F.Ca.ET.090.04.2.1]